MVMASPQASNLMIDGLKKLLHGVADLRLADDADDAAIDAIQQSILAPIRGQVDQMMGGEESGGDPSAMGGLPPELQALMGGMGGGGEDPFAPTMTSAMAPALSTGGGGVPGLNQIPALPPVDELRRLLGASSQ